MGRGVLRVVREMGGADELILTTRLSYSPSGALLLGSGPAGVTVYDAETLGALEHYPGTRGGWRGGEEVIDIYTEEMEGSATTATLRSVDRSAGASLPPVGVPAMVPIPGPAGLSGVLRSLGFAVWDGSSLQIRWEKGVRTGRSLLRACLSPDGRLFAIERTRKRSLHLTAVFRVDDASLAWAKKGSGGHLAFGVDALWQAGGRSARRFDPETGEEAPPLPLGFLIDDFVVGADGVRYCAAGDGRVATWTGTGEDKEEWAVNALRPSAIALSPDGSCLAVSDRSRGLLVLDLRSREVRSSAEGHLGAVRGLCRLGDDGLASVGDDGAVVVWEDSVPTTQRTLDRPLTALVSDRGRLVAGDDRGAVWRLTPDGPTLLTQHKARINALAHAAGTLCSGAMDQRVHDLESEGRDARVVSIEATGVVCLAGHPTLPRLLVGREGGFELWDIEERARLASSPTSGMWAMCAAASPDGSEWYTADDNGDVSCLRGESLAQAWKTSSDLSGSRVMALCGERVLVGDARGRVEVFSVESGARAGGLQLAPVALSAAIAADDRVWVGCESGAIYEVSVSATGLGP